jgi:hypothetical protein
MAANGRSKKKTIKGMGKCNTAKGINPREYLRRKVTIVTTVHGKPLTQVDNTNRCDG